MLHFQAENLYASAVSIADICRRFGSPLYVYDADTIRTQCRHLISAFAPLKPHLHYSVKANSNLTILRLLQAEGLGFDIVSGGELARLQAADISTTDTSFAGVGKSQAEIKAALLAGIRFFNVESAGELVRIATISGQLQISAQVLLRLNPNVDAKTHRYITTGKAVNKFGLDFDTATNLCDQYHHHPWLKIVGFHMHIGSQITTIEPYVQATQRMLNFIQQQRDLGRVIEWLNLGGGFGINYQGDTSLPISELVAELQILLVDQNLQLILEPGRSLVARAGLLLTTVQYLKQAGPKQFIIVDSGMHHLIRPALYDGWHKIWPIHQAESSLNLTLSDVVGPICESTDFLAQDRLLPAVKPGDMLAVFDAGAYGSVMASNYNSHPRPAEVLVDGDSYRLIRQRESFDDLLAHEVGCL